MNLRDLHYLVAVADLHSFVQAAQRCFISQPTLSMQIKKLEDSLGVQIFERSNKKVLITPIGAAIIASARRIIQETELIEALAENAQDPLAGKLRLGGFPTLSTYLFPQLAILIKQNLPGIHLILVEEKTDGLLQQLKNGELDAALLALPLAEEGLETCLLFSDEFLLAVPSTDALAARTKIKQVDLAGRQVLLLDEGHCLRGQALQVCRINGADEHQDLRATGLETLRQMVKAGAGMTFMPEIAVRPDEAGIRYLRFAAPAPYRHIALVWRKTSVRTTLFNELSRLVQQAVQPPSC
ncbi:LysR family transcriptional regulator [Methylomonas paludis]|uniref:LysR family transcriptional regulator n=1 Tax=Methylomonas paludis TaxID=1173101 RepID=A0A975RBB9_9GAMM|nr:LysR substrate-binding domain-containing protein [Methylomonas paludis]QWF72243.1 LysR family transcriptional regulator [Methylomonas paludis]